ncbi:CREB/ATF bZIP transcription factor [Pseudophryne corroboree]|uniref:CREB/ATF bZIP transcription factor n=1 Tax=Pseudophryne corroboree TaxID=495146 RepID=UPI0030820599
MRHRLRERPQPAMAASSNGRRKARRNRAAPAGEELSPAPTTSDCAAPCCEKTPLPELEDLLAVDEACGWWEEDAEVPEDPSLADLLQQLVGCEDVRPSNTLAACSTPNMAASTTTPKMAAAFSSTINNMTASSHNTTTTADQPGRRRGGPSNRNALAARLNRLRRKEYVSGLEVRVARLAGENARLERERETLGARVRELEEESRYLRAVLANDTSLCQLLGRLTGLGGVRMSTSLFLKPRPPRPADHDYALPRAEEGEPQEGGAPSAGGGVCLHVDQDKVSVEFCPACSRRASSAAKIFFFR